MRKFFHILLIYLLVIGCSQNDKSAFYHNIQDFQGVWRNNIFDGKDDYVEELIIKDNSIKYTLTNANTHVILDTLSGFLLLGSENQIGWNCISPITKDNRQLNWNVLSLSTYQMRLYSNLKGEHNYRRVYRSSIEEYEIQDTLMEMLQYKQHLPLHKDEFVETFGLSNRLSNDNEIIYFTRHPLFSQISFKKNSDNDSIYSYSLSVKDWSKCYPFISSDYSKFRNVGHTTEYIDGESLETSNNIVITDSNSKQIMFLPIKDFDYWPNAAYYLGRHLQEFMNDYSTKYVYEYQENPSSGLRAFKFLTSIDSICSNVFVAVDSTGMIRRSGVSMLKTFISNKKKDAQKELDSYASFLNRKYSLDKTAWDENGNKIYYYYPSQDANDSKYEIRLMLAQYNINNITKTYQVRVYYVQL